MTGERGERARDESARGERASDTNAMSPSRQRPQYATTERPQPMDRADMVVLARSIAGSKTRSFQSDMSCVESTVEMTRATAWPERMLHNTAAVLRCFRAHPALPRSKPP